MHIHVNNDDDDSDDDDDDDDDDDQVPPPSHLNKVDRGDKGKLFLHAGIILIFDAVLSTLVK
ncbi:hypothetical protein GX48_00183 [Paracoccidioides brasiliensis]|nr:hypothetical protein GX48_00183 [Paracoccidioides brasiliensis]